jgi:hypothetical protein
MAGDRSSVNDDSMQPAGRSDAPNPESGEPDRVQPGITVEELIARVGDLKLPDGGFADDLEAVQASQPLAEMPEWPD